MSDTVESLFGGPSVGRVVNEDLVSALSELLERAKSGEIIGIACSSVHWDHVASYSVCGLVGGYSLLGGLEMAKAEIISVNFGGE